MTITHAKLRKSEYRDSTVEIIELTIDGVKWGVPKDPDNTMYKEYLKWVAEGNTVEEAG
tara:strand:+ start:928 stop:1104 length:177 start_codon:yes stop_codon:yes gene_type:complete